MDNSQYSERTVLVTGVSIPFWDLVVLFVKMALASIPAAIILFIIGLVFAAVLAGIGLGLGGNV